MEKFCSHVDNVLEEEVNVFHLTVNIIKQEEELRMELQRQLCVVSVSVFSHIPFLSILICWNSFFVKSFRLILPL